MSLIWINGPDPDGECCGCEGKTSPCDPCSSYCWYGFTDPIKFESEEDALNFLQYVWQDCRVANQSYIVTSNRVEYLEPDVSISSQEISGTVFFSMEAVASEETIYTIDFKTQNVFFCVSVKAGTEIVLNVSNNENSCENNSDGQGTAQISVAVPEVDGFGNPYFYIHTASYFWTRNGIGGNCVLVTNDSTKTFTVNEDKILHFYVPADVVFGSVFIGKTQFTKGNFSITFSKPVTLPKMRVYYEGSNPEEDYVTCSDLP